jgi:hypothetical protein
VSLATSQEVAKAGELARWIGMDSKLHPATRDEPVSLDLFPGGAPDPTVKWALTRYDDYILDLQRRAYEAALRLVAQRRTVIETVARELCENRCGWAGPSWAGMERCLAGTWLGPVVCADLAAGHPACPVPSSRCCCRWSLKLPGRLDSRKGCKPPRYASLLITPPIPLSRL